MSVKKILSKVGMIASALVVAVFIVGTFLYQHFFNNTLSNQYQKAVQIEKQVQLKEASLAALKAQKSKYSQMLDASKKFKSNQASNYQLLSAVNQVVPGGVWFTNIEFSSPNSLMIKGDASNDQVIGSFIERLQKVPIMVLVTGPTGSGKSITLYGALKRLNKPGVNILTAEDPVECTIDGVWQVQIRDDIGLTFASALRSFLRQDPEIILVGEIRDKETADISIKAALTGHLVLSTLHAHDSVSTVVRLINMGIPGYLIGAALTLVIAQRLARRICPACKQEHAGNHEAILLHLGFSAEDAKSAKPYHGAGCEKCNHTGYKGRQDIYEVLKISEAMRAAIVSEDRRSLKKIAEEDEFRPMQSIGRQMVLDGILTIEEY
ncbi:ATPase, T2SS/T4P/T4SS family [Polynucleobacter necessarius]|uniref:ATPase, T2SS/T4P/T4SS family n=1 Tax=Polynucleobacter necessarius TaxID=576610 RepID=UPI0013B04DAC|nr:ATPase, T2SS/T4P/T4SS family [Polynucleobacter necessarius]